MSNDCIALDAGTFFHYAQDCPSGQISFPVAFGQTGFRICKKKQHPFILKDMLLFIHRF